MADYTWKGADGGNWQVAGNWVDSLGTIAVQAPGSVDAAEFIGFSGTVTGAMGADQLYIAGGGLTLGGGDGTAGAFQIESGHQFSGVGAIAGNVVNDGSVETFNGGNAPTVLSISGNVSGGGHLSAVQELDVGGGIARTVTIGLSGIAGSGTHHGLLRLADPASDAGTLDVMSVGSTIALTGMSFDSAVWSPGGLTMTGGRGR